MAPRGVKTNAALSEEGGTTSWYAQRAKGFDRAVLDLNGKT